MDTNNQKHNREHLCWEYYLETVNFGSPNAYQSAIKAGYSEDHARNITLQGWFKDRMTKLQRTSLLSKAEQLLLDTLELSHLDPEKNVNLPVLKIKLEIAKHLTSTLGKRYGYSPTIDEEEMATKTYMPRFV